MASFPPCDDFGVCGDPRCEYCHPGNTTEDGALLTTTKTVPLVVYEDGIRHVIGDAIVNLETGEVTCAIHGKGKVIGLSNVSSVTIKGSMSFSVPESLQGPRQTIEEAIPEEEDAEHPQHSHAHATERQESVPSEEEAPPGRDTDSGSSRIQDASSEPRLAPESLGREDDDPRTPGVTADEEIDPPARWLKESDSIRRHAELYGRSGSVRSTSLPREES